jgi:hypothetical protein
MRVSDPDTDIRRSFTCEPLWLMATKPYSAKIDTKSRPDSDLNFTPICDGWKLETRENRRGLNEAQRAGLFSVKKQADCFSYIVL